MIGLREDLVEGHRARSGELWDLLATLSDADLERRGYQDDWSAKDLLAHLAAWHERGRADLERIRAGTYAGRPGESPQERLDRLERENAEYHRAWTGRPLEDVRGEWAATRDRLLAALAAFEAPTEDAVARFRKVAIEHYDDHLPRLREWVLEAAR